MSNFTDIEMNENRRQPGVTISWENVAISSKPFLCSGKEDEILRNVYGIVKPGEMVALMGARYYYIFRIFWSKYIKINNNSYSSFISETEFLVIF